MNKTIAWTLAIAGFFAFATTSRTQSVIIDSIGQATTGMVGFTTGQTARLSVLNLNSTSATTIPTTPGCNVELKFVDGQNNALKSAVVLNFAPQTATSLDLTRAEVTSATAARAEIRGVVTVNPPLPVASPVAPGYCTVFPTLEVFDMNGSTIAFTSDTRSLRGGFVVPLAAR